MKGKTAKQIKQDLYNTTINFKKYVNGTMYENALKIVKKVEQRYDPSKDKDNALSVWLILSGLKASKLFSHNINEQLKEEQSKLKEQAIDKSIKDSRNSGIVFYLASSHKDSADDHRDYQNRIYIDENWRNYVNEDEKKKIATYIAQHNTMSMQKVMDRPVWFITRPYCRHYFQPIPTEQVLSKSVKKLARTYHTYRRVGDREYLQSIATNTHERRIIGEKRNAELVLEKYKERLEEHKLLYKAHKNVVLQNAIRKDVALIKKWNEYLTQL